MAILSYLFLRPDKGEFQALRSGAADFAQRHALVEQVQYRRRYYRGYRRGYDPGAGGRSGERDLGFDGNRHYCQ